MQSTIQLFCIACVASILVMSVIWVWATAIGNYGIVDVFWAFNFSLIAVLVYVFAKGDHTRKLLVSGLAILWSLRLGLYLALRIFSHIGVEEGRYQQLRRDWARHRNLKFFLFFQSQALSNAVLCIPFYLIASNPAGTLSIAEYTGACIWLLAIIGEAVADFQLQMFKKQAQNKGKVCSAGLWNYSRHPNYFFQLLIWIGVFLFALPSPYGWLSAICPLAIGYLIFRVTGIPMTEQQSLRSKGDAYREYQQSTSAFIPWFKPKPLSRHHLHR